MLLGAPVDPYFRLPLWFSRPFFDQVLWAYNRRHLLLLRDYVAATQRKVSGQPDHHSLIVRLPAWMKLKKNRVALVKACDDLLSEDR